LASILARRSPLNASSKDISDAPLGGTPNLKLLLLQTHEPTTRAYNQLQCCEPVTTPRFDDSAFTLLADLEYLTTPPSYWWICDSASSASFTPHTKVFLTGQLRGVLFALATAAVCDFGQFFGHCSLRETTSLPNRSSS
jgi:hypothetical protein